MPAASTSAADNKRKVLNRLRRASGQLTAVIASVEAETGCQDVITQLTAVRSALDKAGFAILSNALQECLDPASPDGDGPTREQLEKLFLMLA
ncbi:MAG: metal-sensitive transcriptional regulator [Propionibacteriaceae bacterium]|mgnify:CR=1 FL=1|jgi:DNA-binding FrmR family transcriptional regulator|nr:metal-sensitive transcriptional regulator [Propionibacteriaceae bacterium]